MTASPSRESSDPVIDALLAEYLERVDAGEEIDREEFLRRHAQHADSLRKLLDAGEVVDRIVAANRSRSDIGEEDTWSPSGSLGPMLALGTPTESQVDADAPPFLKQCRSFGTLPSDVLRVIESNMSPQRYKAGDVIIKQGDLVSSLLVVRDGVVEITTDDESDSRHFIGRCDTGQVLGEMSLLTAEPRTANVIASTDVEMLVLPSGVFHELASLYPGISVVLTRLFATRLGGRGRDVLAGKSFGGYRFNRHLARGGMGVVYEATHIETGLQVALKMMSHRLVYDCEALMRFQREADIIESFEHPNIVNTYGRFTAFHTYFIAMELCDGQTLEDVIHAVGPLPESEFRKIMGQLAAAIDYAHSLQIIHRDIKPANVMLNRDGQVKLTDFGLAKPVNDSDIESDISIVGTPRYMSPEQLAGSKEGIETDYFALGCVAFQMLTGQALFQGATLAEICREHASYRTPDFCKLLPEIGADTTRLLAQCLSPSADQRRPDLKNVITWAAPCRTELLNSVSIAECECAAEKREHKK